MIDNDGDELITSWIVFKFIAEDSNQEIFRSISMEHRASEEMDFAHWVEEFLNSGLARDWRKKYPQDLGSWKFVGYNVINDEDFAKYFPDKARIAKEISILKKRIADLVDETHRLP